MSKRNKEQAWPTISGFCVQGCTFKGHAPGCTLTVTPPVTKKKM